MKVRILEVSLENNNLHLDWDNGYYKKVFKSDNDEIKQLGEQVGDLIAKILTKVE